jgi:hypothetical protein
VPELSPTGFEVLQVAVRVARDQQIKTLLSLRANLGRLFPSRADDIDQAIAYWAAHVQRTGVAS